MMDRVRRMLPLACALTVAACGGDGDGDAQPRSAKPTPTPTATADEERERGSGALEEPEAGEVRVVREWADTLRRGDVRGAARFFALPSTVANGTSPIRLETRAEVRFFNRTLPCGAKVIGTEPGPNGFFFATFRLTERPGPGSCGSGTGATARTAFRVVDDHITDWLRVQDAASAPTTPA